VTELQNIKNENKFTCSEEKVTIIVRDFDSPHTVLEKIKQNVNKT
jgi:hypothetical protein